MTEIAAEVEIAAPVARVWEVLTGFDSYPEWNPFIVRAGGGAIPRGPAGGHDQARWAQGDDLPPHRARPEPNRELRWLGRLVLPGIFDGEHIHELEEVAPGRTRYAQRERGLLVPFVRGILDSTERGFRAMNSALKARAETGR